MGWNVDLNDGTVDGSIDGMMLSLIVGFAVGSVVGRQVKGFMNCPSINDKVERTDGEVV